MLEGVREKVEDDLVEVPLIDPQVLHGPFGVQREGDAAGRCEFVEGLHDVPDEIDDVRFQEMQLHLPLVHLSHVHELVHHAEDAQGVAVHEVVKPFRVRVLLRFAHLLERRHQEGERGADLMGDVGEHLELEILDLRGLPLLFQTAPAPHPIHEEQDAGGQQGAVNEEGPDGQVPGIGHMDLDGTRGVFVPGPVEIGLDGEGVVSRGKVRVGGDTGVRRSEVPVAFEGVQPVGIPDLPRIGVLEDGEFQREGVLQFRQGNPGGFGDVLVQDAACLPGDIVHLFVLHREPAEIDRRDRVRLLVDDMGVEHRHASGTAEEQLPVRVFPGGPEVEFVALEAVVGVIVPDAALSRVQAAEPVGGGYPEDSVAVLEDAAYHVAGKAVGLRPGQAGAPVADAGGDPFARADPHDSVGGFVQAVHARLHGEGSHIVGQEFPEGGIVADRAVECPHPDGAAAVDEEGADPLDEVVGDGPDHFLAAGVQDGHSGTVGPCVHAVGFRIVGEANHVVRADALRVGEGLEPSSLGIGEQAVQVGGDPEYAVPVVGQGHDGVVGEPRIVRRVEGPAPVLLHADDAAAVGSDPE